MIAVEWSIDVRKLLLTLGANLYSSREQINVGMGYLLALLAKITTDSAVLSLQQLNKRYPRLPHSRLAECKEPVFP